MGDLRVIDGESIGERVLQLGRLLRPMSVVGYSKRRFGCQHDGGYVQLNDLSGIKAALSLGIEANASWDLDIAEGGIPVFQFDHTISESPAKHDRFIFHSSKIVASDETAPASRTLVSILNEVGPFEPASAILKIDIENDEWPVFEMATEATLQSFAQIVCEFHSFEQIVDPIWFERARNVLGKLNRQFATIHVHANNFAPMLFLGGVPFPSVLEVSYANRARYALTKEEELFPGHLDSPNQAGAPDFHLGSFIF